MEEYVSFIKKHVCFSELIKNINEKHFELAVVDIQNGYLDVDIPKNELWTYLTINSSPAFILETPGFGWSEELLPLIFLKGKNESMYRSLLKDQTPSQVLEDAEALDEGWIYKRLTIDILSGDRKSVV